MTREQFNNRLTKLILRASNDGLCDLCTLVSLAHAVFALRDAIQPTDEALHKHGFPGLEEFHAQSASNPNHPPKGLH
jgi:hypothetical protein